MRKTLTILLKEIRNSLPLTVVFEEHILKFVFRMQVLNSDVNVKFIQVLYSRGESQLELRRMGKEV